MSRKKTTVFESLGLFVLALGLVLGVRWAFYEPFVIPSGSMIPSLLIHDHILVKKFAYGLRWPFSQKWITTIELPQAGDVVVFYSVDQENIFMVKRVIGLPGDRIEYRKNGKLLVNGNEVKSQKTSVRREIGKGNTYYHIDEWDLGGPFSEFNFFEEEIGKKKHRIVLKKNTFRWHEGEVIIPEGHLFVMGDNRDNSRDSRSWGLLPIEKLVGQARFVWLSCKKTLAAAPFICDPGSLRWDRFFHRID